MLENHSWWSMDHYSQSRTLLDFGDIFRRIPSIDIEVQQCTRSKYADLDFQKYNDALYQNIPCLVSDNPKILRYYIV